MITDANVRDHFLTAVRQRRSFYGINDEAIVPDERIEEIIMEAVKHTPSSFNSQSARVVLLLKKEHRKFWNITAETLRKVVADPEQFKATQDKMNAFAAGYGTVLFFEDQTVIEDLQRQFASYKDNFPKWSAHSSGMHQFVVWTALETEGYGASLQHYNPLVDEEVKRTWGLPDSWLLIAQMPFGKPVAQPGEKTYKPLDERVKIFK
ncbi:nitroreductase family protein [Cohnella rhizosphaerae]|uniref:Nitroreductase family protein n=1 Tax=Cohnella rhizosphaerae TaxID=1457232 RepID=A0A9X4KZ64_9BACL|nr:nitroreductase family protein [Cohnella rhizosphaerae]MDG0813121.1 nitroreductase family protein [Cohnella rhizosphaerae]